MSNVLARVPKVAGPIVAAIIRTNFVPCGKRELVHAQFVDVVTMLGRSPPTVAELLMESKDDLLAFAEFPPQHWQEVWSTNPLSVNRLSNDTSLSTLPMTRVPRSLGWKLVEIDGQRSSGYDRFSKEARRHVSHCGRLRRRRIGECLSRSHRCSGVQPKHGSLLRVRYRQLRTVSVGEGQHPCRGLADDGLRVDRLARRSLTRHI